jgi:tetratricopeptide (TPR) repeat protein
MNKNPDALLNLADATAEDILNTPDDELLREVEEDFGDKHALATQFDQMWERAKKEAEEPTAQREALTTAQPDAIRTARPSRAAPASSRQLWLEWFSALFVNRAVWVGVAALLIVVILSAAVLRTLSTQILQVAHKVDPAPEQRVEQERVQQATRGAGAGTGAGLPPSTSLDDRATAFAGSRPDEDVATSLDDRARLYQREGRYADAEPLYQRSLAIREKVLGPDHPDVATSLNNLAGLYQSERRYDDAEPLYQRSLAIREKVLGPDHPDVATSLNNLARLYRIESRYADAMPLYQRELAIREKVLGPDHPDVATLLNNLAQLRKLYAIQFKPPTTRDAALKADSPRSLLKTVEDIDIRDTPSATGAVSVTVPKGTLLEVWERQGDWVKVKVIRLETFRGSGNREMIRTVPFIGWVSAQFLVPH